MHFADEVEVPDGVIPDRLPSVPGKELDMALSLISAFSGKWEPEKYEDTYTAALRKVVRAKVQGKEVHHAPEAEEEAPPDLMEALRASVEQVQRRSRRPARKGSAKRKTRSASRR
jgi:DNA end-binding protein Ku